MANHTAVKVGGWLFRDPITSTQMTGFQERLLRCPNFESGSTHALAGTLEVTNGGAAAVNLRTAGVLGNTSGGNWTMAGALLMGNTGSENGSVRWKFLVADLTSNSSTSARSACHQYSLGGANRTLTLNVSASLAGGDWIIVQNLDAVGILTVADQNAGTITTLALNETVMFVFNGTIWTPFLRGG